MGKVTAFHGTSRKAAYDSILREGFRKGTYFAFDINDARKFGGSYLFEAAFDPTLLSDDVDWQFHILEPLPASAIVRSWSVCWGSGA